MTLMNKLLLKVKGLINKLSEIKDSPSNIGYGYALGIFLATTPFIGFKVLIALIITHYLKWNKLAAVIGVYHVNSLNAAFFYSLSFFIGKKMMGYDLYFSFPHEITFKAVVSCFTDSKEVFLSLLMGGIAIGVPMSVIAFKLILSLINERKFIEISNGNYALVTGASRGLGREISEELAKRNFNLLLVSLDNENLDAVAYYLNRKYLIDVKFMEADLTKNDTVFQIANWANNYQVSVLINNAGIGGTRAFEEASPEYIDNIIQINIRATSMLTRLLLPNLKAQSASFILNVASMASFSPIAYKTVYPASKAFIWNFSRSLYQELKKTNVFVSVIHPGPMKTNPDVTARIEEQGVFGKMGLISTTRMAEIAIKQLFRRDNLVIPGILNKLNWFLMQLVPIWIRLCLVSNVVKREIKSKKVAMSSNTI